MQPQHDIDYNALAQATDTSWGRSSTPKTASYSVKFSLTGNMLVLTYATIVSFASMSDMVRTKKAYASEADSIVADAIKHVKKNYKDLTEGSTLKLDELESNDSLEVINANFVNPKKTAYFRRKVVYEVA